MAENYNNKLSYILNSEFSRLKNCTYVDHAGSALYSKSQMKNVLTNLLSNTYGNPHSRHMPSDLSTQVVENVRTKILDHFNTTADKYDVIFTSGASSGMKVVGECFKWNSRTPGSFIYTIENHTSVLGIREYAKKDLANVYPVYIKDIKSELGTTTNGFTSNEETDSSLSNILVAYSAQCNYSGAKYPLEWIDKIHAGMLSHILDNKTNSHNWYVLLDAAGFAGTCHLDLSVYSPDFVPISFYKIFGYPTGLGCLLVSKRGQEALGKVYFGGGTVEMVDASSLTVKRRQVLHDNHEYGTLPFLDIIALSVCFDSFYKIVENFQNIAHHTFNIAKYFYLKLKDMKHSNGRCVAEIYCESEDWDIKSQGAIVNFNLMNEMGSYIGFRQVEVIASVYNVYLRTGCVCNPGACQRFQKISPEVLKHHFNAGHVCGDAIDLVDGCPIGSVRVSFGYMSAYFDADMVLKMIYDCFIDKSINKFEYTFNSNINSFEDRIDNSVTLSKILIYPVKSCAPMSTNKWPLGPNGFMYDRDWMIVTTSGVTLTLKRIPKMALIKPYVDIENKKLHLSFLESSISVDFDSSNNTVESMLCNGRVCGDKIKGNDCGDDVAEWLNDILEMKNLRLIKILKSRKDRFDGSHSLSFSNESQFLVLNKSSLMCLQNKLSDELTLDELSIRFRPNLVVDWNIPFHEDAWKEILFGEKKMSIKGPCTRCQMISVSSETGKRTKEPLLSLASIRGTSLTFGVHGFLPNSVDEDYLIVGMKGTVST